MMTLHLSKLKILKIILEKFDIPYDEFRDQNNALIDVRTKDPEILVTWEGSGFQVVPSEDV